MLIVIYYPNLHLKTITTDFESALINALEFVFPGVRKVGCFYHFVRDIKEQFKSLDLLKNLEKTENSKINLINENLNDVFTLPFSINNKDYTNIDSFL